ncbi:ABC transporter permease [Dactylosporangium roseum]|uniref:ABC transporter permease n=1 Tax=Dactylosporangium roseum TaxID=47989 RepID=A0ABY5YZH0_9ACTN|nr:ABC transporter permease [Dactylosporangium roseum]UWZ35155.1 ABC transporter permease [Dactylosporangium roseum]
MTTTTAPSAYPFDLAELLPRARALAEALGQTPSRNRLMKELKIGAPKATALREALEAAEFVAAPAAAPSLPTLPDVAPDPAPIADPTPAAPSTDPVPVDPAPEAPPQATGDGHPDTNITTPAAENVPAPVRKPRSWPVWLLALPAFVAIWSGWVGLGELTGFGVVHPLPGIADDLSINTAITLPIGVETYAAYALSVWLAGTAPAAARRFARASAIGSLIFGGAGQVAYHLLTAAGITHAPWWITTAVACLPVAVLGMGAALAHLIHANHE